MSELAGSHDLDGKLRRGRADLELQRTLLGEAIDEASVLVFVADDEGRYVAVNRQACETLGYSRRDLLGLTVTEVAVAPEAPELYETMLRKGRHEGTTPIRCSDGSLLTFRYWAKAVKVGGVDFWTSVGGVEPTTAQSAPRS
jgi:PAS domain S-box-containing protein